MAEQISGDARSAQIAREIRNDIEAGRLRPGDRLPATRALAEQWSVGLGTVNTAMEQLVREGLVISRPRSGRVVADRPELAAVKSTPVRPRVVYVGGYAGSGKTETGRILARQTGWAMLDKDTLTRSVVDTALVQLGSTIADRESSIYLDFVRPAEYQCLEAAVLENISCGVSVIATAPYLKEFREAAWFERTAATLAGLGADMSVIWIRCSAASMRSYIERRGAARDTWKLTNWDQYIDGIDVTFEPPWPHTVISNNPADEPIQAQVKVFLEELESTR
ncbi:GntR family transcriptional regulator [Nocardia sp. NPDC049737]|uniref:AAA family ATPase n=1 Tax=Nocardia sp. NPDC049737 TaxID=3154358 RepID=UPI00341EEE35